MTTYIEKGRRAFLRHAGERVPVEIVAVAGDTVAVKLSEATSLQEGKGAQLECHDGCGVASYHTAVVATPRSPGDATILQRATSVTPRQRRRTWRVPLDTLTYVYKHGNPEVQEASTVNISVEGALIETDAALSRNDTIDMSLALPGYRPFPVRARVIRAEPADPAQNRMQRFGVWFIELPPKARRPLTIFIWRQLLRTCPEKVASLFPGSRGHRKASAQRRRATDKQPQKKGVEHE